MLWLVHSFVTEFNLYIRFAVYYMVLKISRIHKRITWMIEVFLVSKMTKKTMSSKYVQDNEFIFRCPICHSPMKVMDEKSLVCENKHTFDFTKQGYVNLLKNPVKTKYEKNLFEARRRLMTESGFFEPVCEEIAKIIQQHASLKTGTFTILDTGCGDGSHLNQISNILQTNNDNKFVGVGIDLSKEGINVASKYHMNKIWCVADLANTPFKDKQFDTILNILSPSNYEEFNRLLKEDGMVIKVVPQSGYLHELRESIFDNTEKQSYSNVDTVERFKESYQMVTQLRVCYAMELEKDMLGLLVQMTPLTWATTDEQVQTFLNRNTAKITVDVDILIGSGCSKNN